VFAELEVDDSILVVDNEDIEFVENQSCTMDLNNNMHFPSRAVVHGYESDSLLKGQQNDNDMN